MFEGLPRVVDTHLKKLPQVTDTKLLIPRKIRKCSEEYFCHGFSSVTINNVVRPECVVCGKVLSNTSMKPSQVTRYLNTKHSNLKEKNVSFSNVCWKTKNKYNMHTYLSSGNTNVDAVEASFRISYHMARSGKNYTIDENLILPSIKDAVHCMFGEKHVNKINAISLSNDIFLMILRKQY